jgi:hypothetical protein
MSPTAAPCVKRSQFRPQPSGLIAVEVSPGAVLSIQKDGTLETRPSDKVGPWESGSDQQTKWVVSDPSYPTGSYAILIADE